jgi:hypothetical protein
LEVVDPISCTFDEMIHESMGMVAGLALGFALSACCGFRVFAPLLITGIAAHIGWIPIAPNVAWIGSWTALICFATASLMEIGAYYIPVIDNLLDTIATPAAVIAGTILSAATFVHLDPTYQWILAAIVGGSSAGLIQAGSGLTRLLSTKATAGTTNHLLATGENTAAVAVPIFALLAPVIIALLMLCLSGVCGYVLWRVIVKGRK